jgi:hypothetical protein
MIHMLKLIEPENKDLTIVWWTSKFVLHLESILQES